MASEGVSWGEEDFGAAEGIHTEHSDQQVDDFDQDLRDSGDEDDSVTEEGHAQNDDDGADGDQAVEYADANVNADADADAEDGDGGDYDPESLTIESTPQVPDTSASTPSQRPASKPKVSGGFLVEASDDEDDEDTPQSGAAAQPFSAVSGNPSGAPVPVPNAPSNSAFASAPIGIDPVVMLESRIKEDPRGAIDAWLNLVNEYRRRNRLDDVRSVYNRFFDVFPQASDIWADWLEMELGIDNFIDAEKLFARCLRAVPSVRLLTVYLNYIRRRNDLTNDPTGVARQTITQSYEFVLDTIGIDRDSGGIWQDYVQFAKSAPGDIRGTSWKDQQKMDQIRSIYHRAITVPMSNVNNLWKEYDQFEMSLNKLTGRKFIQERSPAYMTAKSANIYFDNNLRNLKRTTVPRLPPAPGFDGEEQFREQVDLWKKWIAYEKDDPLVLLNDEPEAYKKRVLYCYKQALAALRYWPEVWVDAAEWCFENGVRENDKDVGIDLLLQGIAANPESVLLALKHADHIEATYPAREGDKSAYAKAVQKPYDEVLDTLYAMGDRVKEREELEVNTLKQAAAQEATVHPSIEQNEDYDDDQGPKRLSIEERIVAIQRGYGAEAQILSRTISFVWIALARAMRRIEGKGNQTDGGLRKVFTDARLRGRITSDVYVAVALLESVVYKDPVGSRIFDRGARLFPTDEYFMVEYLKFLHSKDDTTNARVVFETCANRLVAKPETLYKARPLYAYFHKYESQYGELSQIAKLEARMSELFPGDPKLKYFTERYSSDKFNPIAAPIIISKAVQMRPKQIIPTIEHHVVAPLRDITMPPKLESPRPQYIRATASPKRPLIPDDDELNPPKRVARGASPLKGAAGRRLDQQRRNQTSALHRDITFLIGILPPTHSYDAPRLSPGGVVSLLQNTPIPDYGTWKARSGGQRVTHARQPSAEFANRPAAAGGYRNSPLGAGAAAYAPPEGGAQAGWPAAAGGFGQAPPQGGPQYGGYRY